MGCGAIGKDMALFIEKSLKDEAYFYAIVEEILKQRKS